MLWKEQFQNDRIDWKYVFHDAFLTLRNVKNKYILKNRYKYRNVCLREIYLNKSKFSPKIKSNMLLNFSKQHQISDWKYWNIFTRYSRIEKHIHISSNKFNINKKKFKNLSCKPYLIGLVFVEINCFWNLVYIIVFTALK